MRLQRLKKMVYNNRSVQEEQQRNDENQNPKTVYMENGDYEIQQVFDKLTPKTVNNKFHRRIGSAVTGTVEW